MDRLNWDDYFMIMSLWARVRSQDLSTKCGCILVDTKNKLIGLGYNGHARGVDFNKMPQTRPEKYSVILHSEHNAILNSTGQLEGATAYISGPPCNHCWAQLIQVGIKRVVYGPITTSKDGAYANSKLDSLPQIVQDMLENHNIKIVKWQPSSGKLILRELSSLIQLLRDSYQIYEKELD